MKNQSNYICPGNVKYGVCDVAERRLEQQSIWRIIIDAQFRNSSRSNSEKLVH